MTTVFNPPIGDPPSIQLVAPGRLKIDERYQRALSTGGSQTLIARMARDWDWRLCVPLLVSQRDDGLYVIDGQHRREAAARRGDIPLLPCCVSEYRSAAEEASIFVAANRKRRAVNRVDTFRAAVLAGDAVATQIVGLIEGAGLRLARTSSSNTLEPGELNCIGALERVLAAHGPERLGLTLGVLAAGFAGERIDHGAPFLVAVANVLATTTDARAVRDALRQRTAGEWFDLARRDPTFGAGGQNAMLALKRAIQAMAGLAPPAAIGDQPASPPARQPASPPARQPASPPARHPASPPARQPVSPSARQPVSPSAGGKRVRTFEEQLAAVAAGAKLVDVKPLRRPDPEGTLGGVATGML